MIKQIGVNHSYDYRPNWTPLSPVTITNNNHNHNHNNNNNNYNKLKNSIALFPDMIKSALQKFRIIKYRYILNGEKIKNQIYSDSLKRKVLIDFLKLFR